MWALLETVLAPFQTHLWQAERILLMRFCIFQRNLFQKTLLLGCGFVPLDSLIMARVPDVEHRFSWLRDQACSGAVQLATCGPPHSWLWTHGLQCHRHSALEDGGNRNRPCGRPLMQTPGPFWPPTSPLCLLLLGLAL